MLPEKLIFLFLLRSFVLTLFIFKAPSIILFFSLFFFPRTLHELAAHSSALRSD